MRSWHAKPFLQIPLSAHTSDSLSSTSTPHTSSSECMLEETQSWSSSAPSQTIVVQRVVLQLDKSVDVGPRKPWQIPSPLMETTCCQHQLVTVSFPSPGSQNAFILARAYTYSPLDPGGIRVLILMTRRQRLKHSQVPMNW